tara:strand:+ start:2018 stop:2290 length:273 start_codon:yes stop_codon:yes gene_type:complete
MIKYLLEFLGTFIFLSVIIITGDPIAIGIALVAAIYLCRKVTGSHFNPAVNFMLYLDNKLSPIQLVGQTIAQLLGAVAALSYYKYIKYIK